MSQSSTSRECSTCGAPAMHGLSICGRCLAEEILSKKTDTAADVRKELEKQKQTLITTVAVAAAVIAIFAGVLVVNSAWWKFRSVQERDTVAAYESFLKDHGRSDQARIARTRAAELDYARTLEYPHLSGLREFIEKWPGSREESDAKEEIQRMSVVQWQTLRASTDSRALQRFIGDYHGTPEVNLATARINELSILEAWEKLRNSDNLQALATHATGHQGHETAALANQRIEALCNNYDWVKRQDKLPIYRAYLKQNPNSPHKAAVEKRIIDLEVAEILAGEHGELPPASPTRITGGSITKLEIENATTHILTVRYSGNQSYRFDLPPQTTREFSVAADTYRVAASVASPGVTPYAGSDTMQGGSYSSKFYIKTGFR